MRGFLLLILFYNFVTVSAQQRSYFHFDRITTQEGLPSDNTKKIIQDKQGFIWIGTSEGLCRYDGYHVTTFTYNPLHSHIRLVNNFIYDLSEDENGNIWIATAGGWCELLYNTQTFLNANDFKNFHGKKPDFNVEFILGRSLSSYYYGWLYRFMHFEYKRFFFSINFIFPKQHVSSPGRIG